MDAVLLTWRWQNILSIWIMAVALFLIITLVQQAMIRKEGADASNG